MRPGGSGKITTAGAATKGPDVACSMVTLSLQVGTGASVGIGTANVVAGSGVRLAAVGDQLDKVLVGNLNQISVAAADSIEVGYIYWI